MNTITEDLLDQAKQANLEQLGYKMVDWGSKVIFTDTDTGEEITIRYSETPLLWLTLGMMMEKAKRPVGQDRYVVRTNSLVKRLNAAKDGDAVRVEDPLGENQPVPDAHTVIAGVLVKHEFMEEIRDATNCRQVMVEEGELVPWTAHRRRNTKSNVQD